MLGHKSVECPTKDDRKREAPKDTTEPKGKKARVNASLVPNMFSGQQDEEASELCKTWGKIRDWEVLMFFDNGAKANFLTRGCSKARGHTRGDGASVRRLWMLEDGR